MKNSCLVYTAVGLCVGFCIAVQTCTGCQSRQLIVHGSSAIMSQDTKRRMEALKAGKSTEQEVVNILGEPTKRLFSETGGITLNYNCVVTLMRTRYLFNPKLIWTTTQDSLLYSCLVSLNPDGTLSKIDYQE